MNNSLMWLKELKNSVNRATGGQIKDMKIGDTVDPLMKEVTFELHEEFSTDEDLFHLRRLLLGFAESNDCKIMASVPWFKNGKLIMFSVIFRRRVGPIANKNPLIEEKK